MTQVSRRKATGLIGAALATFTVAPTQAAALDTVSAKKLVDALVGEINRVIASGKSEQAMYKDFNRIFAKYGDTSYIAAYAMGNDGRRASGAQKKKFSAEFQTYISRKYGARFREFIGGRLEVKSVRPVKSWFEVTTTAFLRGEAPFTVTFLVSNRTGRDKFFNMFIEGINLLLTERTEIGAMIDRRGGNLDKMIADLRTAK
ncbi:MAG: ABC transporter substrate-binding protein [Planktotalea sp.]|uniref:MlaC/ttg2D family ABC transporter substrate-binding protein n=1 Tax=Planktotalea sp. TaxID=2029877 RepID=UPI002602F734|nr:ABC transporter substrate-binding protein [Planktotalea sp.]MDG1077684.1 ABC transporter substrate-binding protein [Planktotalea sp.]MDG1085266.1 ABC transporter substrate-binding protein [Planktotalea sp.]